MSNEDASQFPEDEEEECKGSPGHGSEEQLFGYQAQQEANTLLKKFTFKYKPPNLSIADSSDSSDVFASDKNN